MADGEPDDEWDFYPCRVDEAPASIFLNLRYEHTAPSSSHETLYWLRFDMVDPGEHGMGTAAEAEVLYPAEDGLIERLAALGLIYVGRLRNRGGWQLTFYGPSDQREAVSAAAAAMTPGGRRFEVGSKMDKAWSYYRDFLLPDTERRQWMQDRRLVGILVDHGDPLVTPRRVDHWAYFSTEQARDDFVDGAARDGFVLGGTSGDSPGARPFGARIFRSDSVELQQIHDVVMRLVEIARQHGGEYDGWETSVEKPPSA